MTNTETMTDDLLRLVPCVVCAKHPGMYAEPGCQDGRFDGMICNACEGSLMMYEAVPMPTTEKARGYVSNTPWTSPSDIAFYNTLSDATKKDLEDEWNIEVTEFDGQPTLWGGENYSSEVYCTDCGYEPAASVLYNLRWEDGSDGPMWDEGAVVCLGCGEGDLYGDEDEARESLMRDEAVRRWEARREEGLA